LISYLSTGLGGIGLFLLAMWLITEGLRMVAGPSLQGLLARWTSTKGRGLLAGTILTGLMQSTSAATIAIIGFANAGLVSFQRSVWVIFGSNIGTTLTAWLIALIGFKFKIDAFALPLIGFGAILRAFSPTERYRSIGMTLAGFGILFLAIETLAGGFGSLSEKVTLDEGEYGIVAMVAMGFLITTLTMSSTVGLAIVLTGLAGGLVGFADAAAVMIGAHMGTIVKVLLATLGATSNAKRLATTHILFNLVTGIAALIFLKPLLWLVFFISDATGHDTDATIMLAMFHSLFNWLGILLMWPLEPLMSRKLMRSFAVAEEESVTLRFLDQNVATVPDAIPVALYREFEPLLAEGPMAMMGLPVPDVARSEKSERRQRRLEAMGEFFSEAARYTVSSKTASLLSVGWRVQHNLIYVEETLQRMEKLAEELARSADVDRLQGPLAVWFETVSNHLQAIHDNTEGPLSFVVLVPAYEQAKSKLLQAALSGQISRSSLDLGLQISSLSRRLSEQWLRALNHWREIYTEPDGVVDEDDAAAKRKDVADEAASSEAEATDKPDDSEVEPAVEVADR
jgi:phosphate:Na+ symporter